MSAELAQKRRAEILEAARKCFLSRGFHATSMSLIAKEFGMSAGHIYNHFPSKHAIIEALVEAGLEDFYTEMARLIERQGSYDEVYASVREIFDNFVMKRIALSMEILIESIHDEALRAILHQADRQAREYICELLIQNGQIDPSEVANKAEMLMGMFEGVAVRTLRNPEMDVDAACHAIADRLYTPREVLKTELKKALNV